MGATRRRPEIVPEEILYRTLDGKLGLAGMDGAARMLPALPDVGVETWSIGPVFPDGRTVLLIGIGQGKAWEGSAQTRFFRYDRVAATVTEWAWPERPAPYTVPSAFLPGGERWLVGARVDGVMRLFACDLDGRNASAITGAEDGFTYGETLSPDGDRIAFHAVGTGNGDKQPYSIFTAKVDGSERRLIDREERALCFGPSWSADGQWLVYLKCADREDPGHDLAEIWLARADGGGKWRVTPGRTQLFAAAFGRPPHFGSGSDLSRWSPLVNVISYCRVSAGAVPPWIWRNGKPDQNHFNRDYRPDHAHGGSQLCTLDPFTSGVKILTPAVDRRWDFRGTWSPRGDALAFIRAEVGQPSELWCVNATGGGERRLAADPAGAGVDHPRFLPRIGLV